jgi:hypothetical protein
MPGQLLFVGPYTASNAVPNVRLPNVADAATVPELPTIIGAATWKYAGESVFRNGSIDAV